MGALLAQQLLGAGEHVVDVPPKLSARVRLMDTGRIDKSDPNDARSAAVVALRNATLNTVGAESEDRVILRLLADRYHQLTARLGDVHPMTAILAALGIFAAVGVVQPVVLLAWRPEPMPRGLVRWLVLSFTVALAALLTFLWLEVKKLRPDTSASP